MMAWRGEVIAEIRGAGGEEMEPDNQSKSCRKGQEGTGQTRGPTSRQPSSVSGQEPREQGDKGDVSDQRETRRDTTPLPPGPRICTQKDKGKEHVSSFGAHAQTSPTHQTPSAGHPARLAPCPSRYPRPRRSSASAERARRVPRSTT